MFIFTTVLTLHDKIIERYGGSHGIREANMLDSALKRPFQTFDAEDLYPGAVEKAAAVLESIILNHPFIDGNKRTGFLTAATLLLEHNIKIKASENDLYEFIIKVSTGDYSFEEIVTWLQQNTTNTEY